MRLSFNQKGKLADFFYTIAAGWFAGAIIGPFFLLSSEQNAFAPEKLVGGLFLTLFFLSLSLFSVGKGGK